MSYILHIETATKNCSVALAKDGQLVAFKESVDANYSHAEKLHPFIEDVLKEAAIAPNKLAAIAVSKGPGSYTGLRIGVSAAKGLSFAFDIPLIATDTLASLAKTIQVEEGTIVPMIDARRMEVYCASYQSDYTQVGDIEARIIEEHSFEEVLSKGPVYFLGDGALKCKEVLEHPHAHFIADKYPSAVQMIAEGFAKFLSKDFVDVAYFEPFYLKDFVATQQKKKW